MENHNLQDRTVPMQFIQRSRAFRQFKNPPQPHMCIQDTLRDSSEKLYINVLGWQKIANPKQYSDPIPLYGGMQVPQGCGPNSNKTPLLVFAVMVNPDILKANGKNAPNLTDKEALVRLLCDFVEAMNPGLTLARNPTILKDRDLAGELKDVWLAVQNQREREKGISQEVLYKVYDIDGVGNEEQEEEKPNSPISNPETETSPTNKKNKRNVVKSSKLILMNAGQKSEFDSGMNNCQLNTNTDNKNTSDITYCTPVYGQIVSSRENHNQINDIQKKLASGETTPSTSYRKEWNNENAKRIILGDGDTKNEKINNGKNHYDFYPVFDNKNAQKSELSPNNKINDKTINENSKIIIEPMQKLVLQPTDIKICDSNESNTNS